jgi:hypothetical protein
MKLADFDIFILLRNLARYMQLASMGVEIDAINPNEKIRVNTVGRGCAGGGLSNYPADSRSTEKVCRAN